jgi:hypothetical protein
MGSASERVNWENQSGKKILVADYSGLAGKEAMDVFHESYTTQKAAGTDVLLLLIVTNAKANAEILDALKKAGKELDKDMKKTAIVGISPIQKIFFDGYLRVTGQHGKTRLFKDVEEAKMWLVV